MIQIMKMDVRLQNAEDYYQFIKRIRGDEKVFKEMVKYLKTNYKLVTRTAKADMDEIEGKTKGKLRHKQRASQVSGEAQGARSRMRSD